MSDQRQEQNYRRYLGIRFVLLSKNFSGGWRAGKKWRGFRGGNFLPASRFFRFCSCPAPPPAGAGAFFYFFLIFIIYFFTRDLIINNLHYFILFNHTTKIEICKSFRAETRAGQKFFFPKTLSLFAPPERNFCQSFLPAPPAGGAGSFMSFLQNRF